MEMSEELVKRLWESDAASSLTNEAARRIEELEKKCFDFEMRYESQVGLTLQRVRELQASQARLSEAVKVLEPFAKCSEVYPLADGERDAGFAGLHDSRCPLKIEDYHAARQFIDTIKGDK